MSLERMEWDREKGEVLYRTGRGHAEERGGEEDRSDDVERIDELEFLARVVTQLPEPRKHSIRYYGYYATVVRAQRRQANAEAEASMPAAGNDAVGNVASEARGNVGGVHSAVAVRSAVCSEPVCSEPDTTERKLLRKRWAELIRRVYEVDPLLSRVRRDHADRRDHHREERHHEDPRRTWQSRPRQPQRRDRAPALPATRPPGQRPIPPSTESTTTGWCDDRTGRSLLEQAQSAAQTPPTQPLPPPPCARTAETACTSFEDQPRIAGEHGKRSEKLGISHAVESNAKCFFLSPSGVKSCVLVPAIGLEPLTPSV
jgi:Putative transposase